MYELCDGLVYRKTNEGILFYIPKCMEFHIMKGIFWLAKTLELINEHTGSQR